MSYTGLIDILTDEGIEHIENQPLAPYTSFRIGGAARVAIFPKNRAEAEKALSAVSDSGMRCLVLGNGTNVLISDEGFDGAAVMMSAVRELRVSAGEDGGRMISADAGASLTRIASKAAELSLAGLEFAFGIPGTVGGGVYMNAGAFGGELSQVVTASRWFDPKSGKTGETLGAAHDFGYRHSVYMDSGRIILSADFLLHEGDRGEIEAKMNDYMSRRREKQPLDLPSAGSVFKRGNGFITAKLIEDAGLKGRRVGGAEVSEKHAGFIVNRGGATAADVLSLIEIMKDTVFEKFGKIIECEVRYIPRD